MNLRTFAHVTGWGSHVPALVRTNADVSIGLDTCDAWITERTGIRARHVAAACENSTTMAVRAAEAALAQANVPATGIDLIVCATNTPDTLVPNMACALQSALGVGAATAFDVNSACTGFVFALAVAESLMARGRFGRALIVGSDTMSRVVDWSDRATCVLFGDGAGAVVLESLSERGGIVGTHLGSDGTLGHLIRLPIGLAQLDDRLPGGAAAATVRMAGTEVYRFAVAALVDATRALCDGAGQSPQALDLLIPHQANQRIVDSAAARLGLGPDRVFSCVDRHGNTCAASVPLALDLAARSGRIAPGDRIALVGFGGGLSWGGCLIEWTAPTGAEARPR